eukprot:7445160-Pyramimonas_sp.AAC.1
MKAVNPIMDTVPEQHLGVGWTLNIPKADQKKSLSKEDKNYLQAIAKGKERIHMVEGKNDTLQEIAQIRGVPVESLAALNNSTDAKAKLSPGSKVLVPSGHLTPQEMDLIQPLITAGTIKATDLKSGVDKEYLKVKRLTEQRAKQEQKLLEKQKLAAEREERLAAEKEKKLAAEKERLAKAQAEAKRKEEADAKRKEEAEAKRKEAEAKPQSGDTGKAAEVKAETKPEPKGSPARQPEGAKAEAKGKEKAEEGVASRG